MAQDVIREGAVGKFQASLRCFSRSSLVLVAVLLGFLAVVVVYSPRFYVITGEGESMIPTLRDGGREIFLSWRFLEPLEGGIYLLSYRGEYVVKRVTRVGDMEVWVEGDNQSPDGSIDSREFGWLSQDAVLASHLFSLPECFDGSSGVQMAEAPVTSLCLPSEEERAEDRVARIHSRIEEKVSSQQRGEKELLLPRKARDFDRETGEEFPERLWDIPLSMTEVREIEVVISSTPRDLVPTKVAIFIAREGGEWTLLETIGGGEHTVSIPIGRAVGAIRLEHAGGDPPILNEMHVF